MNLTGIARRALLQGPAWLYELVIRLRIAAYETGYLKSERLEASVVSIGNVTFGGTGKTPLVEYIAHYLSQEGYSVAILSRGYGRKSSGQLVLNASARGTGQTAAAPVDWSYAETGDEPLMLARALPEIPVVINKDRVEGGKWAEHNLGSRVLILDDGYQHLRLARDLNVLVLDATDPFGGFRMAPFGRLREPLYALKRADAVIVTRAHRPFDQGQLTSILKYSCGDRVPIMYWYSTITGLRHLESGSTYEADEFAGWNAWLMSGIGNAGAFVDDVVDIGVSVVGESVFRDHHPYSQQDVDSVTAQAKAAGADLIVTTEKDAVRLQGLDLPAVPIYSTRLEIQSEDEVRLKSLMLRLLATKR